jgi:multidrug efflux pump subunit AcrA (membrane-fusion protein)
LQNILVREGVLVAKIYRVASKAADSTSEDVPDPTGERIRMVEIPIDPSDQVLLDVDDVVTVGQVIARTDISAKLEELSARSLRLKKTYAALELDEVQIRKKIPDLENEILKLGTKKRLAAKAADRKSAQFERDSTIHASFSGKILRIDRHSEGEKIRLSVLCQQSPQ